MSQLNPLLDFRQRIRKLTAKYWHRTYSIHSSVFCSNDQAKSQVSFGHRTNHISHLQGGRKLAYFASPTALTTRIFLEESGLIFTTSRVPFTFLDNTVNLSVGTKRPPLCQIQRPRRYSCWYSSFFIINEGSDSYIDLAGVLGVRDLEIGTGTSPLRILGANRTRAVVFATAPYLYIATSA